MEADLYSIVAVVYLSRRTGVYNQENLGFNERTTDQRPSCKSGTIYHIFVLPRSDLLVVGLSYYIIDSFVDIHAAVKLQR